MFYNKCEIGDYNNIGERVRPDYVTGNRKSVVLGFVKDNGIKGFDHPNTLLRDNIDKRTNRPYPVLAIFTTDISSHVYDKFTFLDEKFHASMCSGFESSIRLQCRFEHLAPDFQEFLLIKTIEGFRDLRELSEELLSCLGIREKPSELRSLVLEIQHGLPYSILSQNTDSNQALQLMKQRHRIENELQLCKSNGRKLEKPKSFYPRFDWQFFSEGAFHEIQMSIGKLSSKPLYNVPFQHEDACILFGNAVIFPDFNTYKDRIISCNLNIYAYKDEDKTENLHLVDNSQGYGLDEHCPFPILRIPPLHMPFEEFQHSVEKGILNACKFNVYLDAHPLFKVNGIDDISEIRDRTEQTAKWACSFLPNASHNEIDAVENRILELYDSLERKGLSRFCKDMERMLEQNPRHAFSATGRNLDDGIQLLKIISRNCDRVASRMEKTREKDIQR